MNRSSGVSRPDGQPRPAATRDEQVFRTVKAAGRTARRQGRTTTTGRLAGLASPRLVEVPRQELPAQGEAAADWLGRSTTVQASTPDKRTRQAAPLQPCYVERVRTGTPTVPSEVGTLTN